MRLLTLLAAGVLAPIAGLAAPAADLSVPDEALNTRDNVCSLGAPPALCQPDPSVTVEETAQRAYKFYRAFVVDGDPKTMFSLIDSTYKVRFIIHTTRQSQASADYGILNHSNTIRDTRTGLRTSGPFSAAAEKSEPRRAPLGASTPARTCRTRNTRLRTDGAGSMAVSTNT